LRPLQNQARLYRQSRSWSEIKAKILKFENRGFKFLADILDQVGPCSGPHRTNAAPGESWHGYAEAWDACVMVDGKLIWRYREAPEHWEAYGEAVRQVGMYWAGDWRRFRERAHAQLRPGSNPLKVYSPDKIFEILTQNKLL
ncbi:unnamed protein product, partial [marine sediment metagenome]